MFLSTEIFSKRRKIFSFVEEKPEQRRNVDAVHPAPQRKSNLHGVDLSVQYQQTIFH